MSGTAIVCVSFSPDDKRIYSFGEAVALGSVNRALSVVRTMGGKAINAASAVSALGEKVLLCGFIGENSASFFTERLSAKGAVCRFTQTEAPTRTCITMLEEGRATELVENCPAVSDAELKRFRGVFSEAAAGTRVLILAGSVPRGCPAAIYAELIREAKSAQAIVDAQGDLLLAAAEAGAAVAKPNKQELAAAFGRRVSTRDEVARLMRELQLRGVKTVVVTDGEHPALMATEERLYEIAPPQVAVKNTIGSGDVLAGGIAVGLKRGMAIEDAVVLGVAAASANAETLIPGEFSPEEAARLVSRTACRLV